MMEDCIKQYFSQLAQMYSLTDWTNVKRLGVELLGAQNSEKKIFLCGNGGSAANADHISNDWLHAGNRKSKRGLKVFSLSANAAITTCLANDEGYENIYSMQLEVLATKDDILIVLSGSGNSPNVIKALEEAKKIGMTSYAMLGFDGGAALKLADYTIHFPIDDMQISEDLQVVVGHILMKWLSDNQQLN